ncbi:glycosyltransferase family 4 protein [Inquilinus limosus]|uniref:glycosyltransferase family 4 protein n=1 Tax=Inquilinus limosus TaxID=171674 RepID=UPI003F166456
MKVAIVAPSSVPFTIGGAENLWLGLLSHINRETPHDAELIKLPSPERNFPELISSYENFSRLDLSHFDLVISTKYPAWMIKHVNHVCYLQHRLRGLYDTYPESRFDRLPDYADAEVTSLQRFMQKWHGQRDALPEFFSRIRAVIDRGGEALAFPGPFAREVVHWLDGIGLSRDAVRKFAAISETVASRQDYFPAGVTVEAIHHPTSLGGLHTGSYDYLFTCSRLDRPKRIDLIINAMRRANTRMHLKIAGIGPEEDRLRDLAGNDPRIEFLGFVRDAELAELYAGARAVVFVPKDEDYGLITVEAMMCGKPVITTEDSGGPNELIESGQTGYSTKADPRELAKAMTALAQSPDLAMQMGAAAKQRVSRITWEKTVAPLLVPPTVSSPRKVHRPKLCVAVTFPIFPPRGGGQSRVFHLYRHLAQSCDVDVVCITNANDLPSDRLVAPGLREIRIPKSSAHRDAELALTREVGAVPITDVAMPRLVHLTPEYREALSGSMAEADVVIASHPYLFPLIREVSRQPIWYEAHNVEIDLKRAMLPDTATARDLLTDAERVEHECCDAAELVVVCTRTDQEVFESKFGVPAGKFVEVPNGVDLQSVSYTGPKSRAANKGRLGIGDCFTVLFMGSRHQPNNEAVEEILRFAPQCPDMRFLLLGSVAGHFAGRAVPENVGFMGEVDDETKDVVLSSVDCAINPMATGSGTNLKMLDYFASGVPVISTPHGARGIAVVDGVHLQLAKISQFPHALAQLKGEVGTAALAKRIIAARLLVQEQYDWSVIARNFLSRIHIEGLVREG